MELHSGGLQCRNPMIAMNRGTPLKVSVESSTLEPTFVVAGEWGWILPWKMFKF